MRDNQPVACFGIREPGFESARQERRKMLKEITIESGDEFAIRADLRTTSTSRRPLVIICHGFLGYKRWGFFPYVSERIANEGFHVLTMSFSMNGVDEETGLIAYPEVFARDTVSREIADLSTVCKYALEGRLPVKIENGIGIMGHSRGAAVAVIVASRNPNVRSLVTWATPSRFDRYTERRKKEWKREGVLRFPDDRATSTLWLDYSYYEDIDRNRDRLDIVKAAESLNIPHLMIHGTRDQAVTLKEAKRLIGKERKGPVELIELKGCSHSFATRHPMQKPSRCLMEAARHTMEFFNRTLKEHKEGD